MTRINVVEPKQLSDAHLLAEYRELPRIFTAVNKLVQSGVKPSEVDIPNSYRLGKGHVKFFYDKIMYLSYRYGALVYELTRRGFNIDLKMVCSIYEEKVYTLGETGYYNDWTPSPKDSYINMARLVIRSEFEEAKVEVGYEQ